jgi:hypothetical protein
MTSCLRRMTVSEETLEAVWAVVHPRDIDADPASPEPLEAGTLVLGIGGKVIVSFRPDGRMEFGENYEPEEAARLFWQAVARKVQPQVGDNEVARLNQRVMEALFARLGEADLYCEQARTTAALPEATEREKFLADLAVRNLEVQMHQILEFARGVALAQREIRCSSEES